MIQLEHRDQSGLLLYVIIYNGAGDKLWDESASQWVLIEDGSETNSPYDYGIELDEDADRAGWYAATINPTSDDGAIVYEVLSQAGSAPGEEDAADWRDVIRVFIDDQGEEISAGSLNDQIVMLGADTTELLNLLRSLRSNATEQERTLIRLSNQAKRAAGRTR